MLLSKPFKGPNGLWERAEDVRQLLLDAGAPSGAKHVPKAKGKAMPQLEPLPDRGSMRALSYQGYCWPRAIAWISWRSSLRRTWHDMMRMAMGSSTAVA